MKVAKNNAEKINGFFYDLNVKIFFIAGDLFLVNFLIGNNRGK